MQYMREVRTYVMKMFYQSVIKAVADEWAMKFETAVPAHHHIYRTFKKFEDIESVSDAPCTGRLVTATN